MANLSLTLRCNQACDYCFATGIPDAPEPEFMSDETFARALGFLKRSDVGEARFLGGEPSLHPRLAEMIQEALRLDLQVLLFSNGLFSKPVLEKLQAIPSDRFYVLINAIPPWSGSPPAGLRRQQRSLQALGPRAMLGLNIRQAGAAMGFLLDWIERYSLKRSLRLGLAHPSLTAGNRYLHPKFYPPVGFHIEELADEAKRRGVSLELDCGFVPCMFSDSFRATFPELVKQSGRRCNPILDVLPSGDIISCFPLAAVGQIRLEETGDADTAISFFRQHLGKFDRFGVYPHCGSCPSFRERSCLGGCRSAAMLRLRPGNRLEPSRRDRKPRGRPTVRLPLSSSLRPTTASKPGRLGRWVLPYIDQPIEFWQQLREDFREEIAEVYFPLPGGVVGSGRPPQPEHHLEEFLRHARLPSGVLVNPVVLPQAGHSLAGLIIDSLRRLRDEYGVRAATITDLLLAMKIREVLPDLTLTGSVLMDVCQPNQALVLDGVFDRLAPSSRIVRDLPALRALRAAFRGSIRLILNEGCLPGCLLRTQHFHEMAAPSATPPESLCGPVLERRPWLRLTGAWVLPQHLHLYDGLYDQLKLAGRVTLRDPARYFQVVTSYILSLPLLPNEIGGGPASVLEPLDIQEDFFVRTLDCGKQCHTCRVCEDEWGKLHRLPSCSRSGARAEAAP